MAQRAPSAADATKSAVSLARAITIGLRSWGFYPPEHPAVGLAVDRFVNTAAEATVGGLLQLAVTPHALLVDGLVLDAPDLSVSECAALLHDRDILQLTFVSAPSEPVIRLLLGMLSLDRNTRRARGGPAAIWSAAGETGILLEQIDYQEILERDFDEGAARRDATWKAIVRSIIMGRRTFTADEQQRLLEISRDVSAIGALGNDCKEPYCTPEGAPLLTTQAATILAVYRHIAKTVTALEPERAKEVIQSLALATSGLDPAMAFEVLKQEDSPDDSLQIISAFKQTFDDQQVAMLLARALATPGHPTSRLAQVLDTLAPDDERKRRVLKLAERLIGERDFGSKRPIDDIRQSLDELLLKYDEKEYVSTEYRESMGVAGARAAELAARGRLPEMDEWLATLGHESVRRLSGQLLMDLLTNETHAERMSETARDMAAFVEDLLLAGVFGEGIPVVNTLAKAATGKLSPHACRAAIDSIGESLAFGEAAGSLAEQSAEEFAEFEQLARAIGPASVTGLLRAYEREDGGGATERASAVILRLGPPAIPRLLPAVDDQRWFVQREVARLLGQIGTAAAVPPLQTLLRRSDLRIMRAAVSSLAKIDDPIAARAIHTVLKATTGQARTAVIEALVGLKDPRVVPLLVRILQGSDAFGDDHLLVLETLGALAGIKDDRALPQIALLARQRRWLSWGKTSRLRTAALRTLMRIDTPKSLATFDELATTGDYFLRRLAKTVAKGT
ncbi:MAG: HEAT repeat domain-containing protein [Vicinamibacterales bacterium]